MIYRTPLFKPIVFAVLISMILESLAPLALCALTQGPTQPEFSTFESVNASNLVDPFTGQFSYSLPVLSIPGPNGMGYALSLSYRSGASPEEEASWVGYGWTLNPGAITRVKRGFPDDYKDASVTYWNSVRNNWTATVTKELGVEAFSQEGGGDDSEGGGGSGGGGGDGSGGGGGGGVAKEKGGSVPLSTFQGKRGGDVEDDEPAEESGSSPTRQKWAKLNGRMTHRYNNYKGYGYSWGLTLGVMGMNNLLGYTENDNIGSWSYSVSPMQVLEKIKGDNGGSANEEWGQSAMKSVASNLATGAFSQSESSNHFFRGWTFNDFSMPYNTTEYSGSSTEISAGVEGDFFSLPIGVEGRIKGSYTVQEPKKRADRKAYGYMYSGSVSDESAMMDYYLEKEGSFQKRDLFLPIPFSDADQFSVSAEGLGGTFRLYHSKPGKFRPNKAESSTDIVHVNADVHLGGTFGLGAEFGYGVQTLTVEDWLNGGYSFGTESHEDEPYFFRFTNDPGGSVEFADNDDPVSAEIQTNLLSQVTNIAVGGMFGAKRVNSDGLSRNINPNQRSGRSAYIGYSTNAEMVEQAPLTCAYPWYSGSPVKFRRYGKPNNDREDERNWIDRNESAIKDGIGEFAITKENGMQYIYDLPVYSRNEINLRYGLTGVSAGNIQDNYLAFHYQPFPTQPAAVGAPQDPYASIVGEESDAPYAAMHLLTEIRSPDYLDIKNDGLTKDDIGGYVRFNYTQVAGTKSKTGPLDAAGDSPGWYRWRSPYRGTHYQRNELSDPFDDVGTVSAGYKELYYLKSIETKTHIALFITEKRRDGYQAVHNEALAAASQTATTVPTSGSDQSQLQRLKKIELYSKNDAGEKGKLLVTVHFEYDYDLCKGLPNAESGEGKLTLKKVWFDYEGVKSARISPYEFNYAYPASSHFTNVPFTGSGQFYEGIVKFADALLAQPGDPQNPDYSPFNVDRWGNYQHDGQTRYQKLNPWVNQKSDPAFDPAAWQLKWIKLPSGGEIHIQYEQNDYRFVEHRPAMVMMNLQERKHYDDDPDEPYTDYAIDVDDVLSLVESSPGTPDPTKYEQLLDSLKTEIQRYFVDGVNGDPEHMFFRFVYALEGDNADLDRCSSEFISGYVKVQSVWTTDDPGLARKLWVRLGDPAADPDDYQTLPEQVCENYVRTSRGGIIKQGSCDGSESGVLTFNDDNDVEDGWEAILSLLPDFGSYFGSDNCKEVNLPDSYLRIPLPASRPKKGGGIRVKRVLTYDKGLEGAEDAALYGTEYLYETVDGLSSGVAVNEPKIGREENSLIGLIDKREAQNGYEKIFSGEDRDQFEGPMGESIMPAASVGYSRVVARNIYPGKTTAGFVVNEFYTSHDYPFDLRYADVGTDLSGLKTDKTSLDGPVDMRYMLMTGIFNRSFAAIRRAQGLRFVLNDMNGKPKSVGSYGGNYHRGVAPTAPIESSVYQYFQPGEKIPVMRDLSTGNIEYGWLGKEMEVVFESRNVQEVTIDGSIQADYGVGIATLLPIPYTSLFVGIGNSDNSIKTFVSSKVVRYPAIQKRVIVAKDGVIDTTEYRAFDPESGSPVLAHSADGFHNLLLPGSATPHDGSYYSQSVPASWYYKSFEQKARSERTILYNDMDGTSSGYVINKRYVRQGGNESHYLMINPTRSGGELAALEALSSGDMVSITQGDGDAKQYLGIYTVGKIVGNKVELLPTSFSLRSTLTEERYVTVEIVHSGRSNRVSATAGEYTTYGGSPTIVNHPIDE